MDRREILRRLRVLRTGNKFSQKEMAQFIGCKEIEYAKKEKGELPISTEEWLKISEALGIPVEDFFLNIPFNIIQDVRIIIHGYNRLSSMSRSVLKTHLDAFLRAEWAEFKAVKKK